MNDKLYELRNKIDMVDLKMKELFLERMDLVKEVIDLKKSINLQIEDKNREETMIINNSSSINDVVLKELYIDFLRFNIELSKTYQKNRI